MQLYKYIHYQEYVDAQIKANKRKEDKIWCNKQYIKQLSLYVKKQQLSHLNIICHGTRNGAELEYFISYFNPKEIIGTEISDTAIKYKNTIQWDFHNIKPEWLQHFDILYSNSLDHSYKPDDCIDTWMSCISSKGIMVIEWTIQGHFPKANISDPFKATFLEFEKMITKKYKIKDIIQFNDERNTRFYIIVHP